MLISLSTQCGPFSGSVTVGTYTSPLTNNQRVHVSDVGGPTEFVLPAWTTDIPTVCLVSGGLTLDTTDAV